MIVSHQKKGTLLLPGWLFISVGTTRGQGIIRVVVVFVVAIFFSDILIFWKIFTSVTMTRGQGIIRVVVVLVVVVVVVVVDVIDFVVVVVATFA